MNRNTSISLGLHFEEYVQGRITPGRLNNLSEEDKQLTLDFYKIKEVVQTKADL